MKTVKDLENALKTLENVDSYVCKLQRSLLKLKRLVKQTDSEYEKRFLEGKIEMVKEVIETLCKIFKIENREITDWHTE